MKFFVWKKNPLSDSSLKKKVSIFSIFSHFSWSEISIWNLPLRFLKPDTWADASSSWLYHDPLLHVFLGLLICMLFFFCFLRICLTTHSFVCWFLFSYPSHLVCLFPDFGWVHFLCVSVLSLPVQCWSLSYGKQRRPFRLYAPTWLRQQVWRSFYFYCTWSLFYLLFFVTAFSIFLGFPCMSHAKHLWMLIFLFIFLRERNSLSREEKLQIKSWNSGGPSLKCEKEFRLLLRDLTHSCVALWCEDCFMFPLLRSPYAHWKKEP